MKRLLALTLFLASSLPAFACYYYPYGEDVRFSLFKAPTSYNGYAPFMYSASWLCDCEKKAAIGEVGELVRPNVDWWRKRAQLSPSEHDTHEAIYGSIDVRDVESGNSFVKWLHEHKDQAAIDYLSFAKDISVLNDTYAGDPWERSEAQGRQKRGDAIRQALAQASKMADQALARRYAFLAIRLAYYNGQPEEVRKIYSAHFQKGEQDLVYYWALSFFLQTERYGPQRSFFAAQVFANAPDKRLAMQQHYDREVNIQQTLAIAKTGEEIANVWLMDGIRKPGKAIQHLRQVYKAAPASKGLSVLLQRELNKLEDWIYTPYYTLFTPAVSNASYEEFNYDLLQKRIVGDRIYAQEVLNFVKSVNFSVVENPELWQASLAYLHYMCEQPKEALAQLGKVKRGGELDQSLKMLEALCQVASGSKLIPENAKPLLMNGTSPKFVLALARELEYKGNTSMAALLLSRANDHIDPNGYWGEHGNFPVFWKNPSLKSPLFNDFYDNYFFYLDGSYTPEQVQALIAQVKQGNTGDAFNKWLYGKAKADLPRLYDLLGTKYLRKDDLKSALAAFEQVPDTLWQSSNYPYKQYLAANPFYTNLYNEHSVTDADTVKMNKATIVKRLMECIAKAESPKEADRDYYYFLVGNCYLNMTKYGNSWMMRRYYWSSTFGDSGLEDDEEYYKANKAKSFYMKAKEHSKTDKFGALCLRMAGRCEKYALLYEKRENYDVDWDELFRMNTTYQMLRQQYPSHYEELIGNCMSFSAFFEARR